MDISAFAWTALAGMGAVQFYAFARLLCHLGARRPAPGAFRPRVAVIVPCRGEPPGLRENVAAMLEQDYSGDFELDLVFASDADPGHRALRSLAAGHGGRRLRLLVSGAQPVDHSEQLANILHGVERAAPEAELFVFCSFDVRVPRGWLSALVAPLASSDAAFSTTALLFVPEAGGVWGLLKMLSSGSVLSYMPTHAEVNGASYAVRRSDFERLGVARLWARSAVDDAALYALVRRHGARVAFAADAAPVCDEPTDATEFFAKYRRWFLWCRVYAPTLWALNALYIVGKLGVLAVSLLPPVSWGLFGAALAVDMLHLGLCFLALERALPDRFARLAPRWRPLPLWAALGAPLLPAVTACHVVASSWGESVVWGGRLIRLRGPQDVVVS